MMKWKISLSLAAILFLGLVSLALAHGVVISYEANENGEIELWAVFDTGEVMSEAQVSIFSPADPATPWLTGTADEEGRFTFTPDQPGTWDVQFRKAGHGDMIHITLEEIIEVDVMEEETPAGVEAVEIEAEAEAETEAEAEAETEEAVAAEVAEAAIVENEAQEADADTEAEAIEAVSREETQTEAGVESAEDVSESVNNETVNNEEPASETDTAAAAETTESAASPTTQRLVVANSGSDGLTTAQILLMSGSVVWGFIGTALFFARGRQS